MATFTDAEKQQLWELFSNDTNDLEEGSYFLLAISDFEEEDTVHPAYNLVSGVSSLLDQISEIDEEITDTQTDGVVAEIDIKDRLRERFADNSSPLQGKFNQKNELIEAIRQRMKFDDYIGQPNMSKVLGVMPMAIGIYGRRSR